MSKSFKGRVIINGKLTGNALVTHQGFNICATYFRGITVKSPLCWDQNNKDLYQKTLNDKILCLPKGIGSTTGGMFLQCAADNGIAPLAMLYSEHVDSVSVAGIIISDVWNDKKIITVDELGDEFLSMVQDGDKITIEEDGTVIVE
ncbi:MAG: DUF126 domain-containing protein [Parasporobacterium sp.]|nr:DUF126 domain-containing protein [Parasporobacterium sp.]